MSEAYREYLELFEYFGRGGLPRLDREQFEAVLAEFEEFVARGGELSAEELDRAIGLRDLLLRERPKRAQLMNKR